MFRTSEVPVAKGSTRLIVNRNRMGLKVNGSRRTWRWPTNTSSRTYQGSKGLHAHHIRSFVHVTSYVTSMCMYAIDPSHVSCDPYYVDERPWDIYNIRLPPFCSPQGHQWRKISINDFARWHQKKVCVAEANNNKMSPLDWYILLGLVIMLLCYTVLISPGTLCSCNPENQWR